MSVKPEKEMEAVTRAQQYAQKVSKSWSQYLVYLEWHLQDNLLYSRDTSF